MKKSGLLIVLAIGLGCHNQVGICRQAPPLHYAAREVKREIQADGRPYLSRAVALAYDDSRLFVLDMEEDGIKVFSKSGVFEYLIGRKGQRPGGFHLPSGLDILAGRLYVADSAHRRGAGGDPQGGGV